MLFSRTNGVKSRLNRPCPKYFSGAGITGVFLTLTAAAFTPSIAEGPKKVSTDDLLEVVVAKTDLTFSQADKAVSEFLDSIVHALREGARVVVLNKIGQIVVSERKERVGRNPKTGEVIRMPARRVLRFKFAKTAREALAPVSNEEETDQQNQR